MDILQKNILEVKDLTKDYPGFHLKMDLAVPAGSIMGLVGPNGAGKSTTLRLILGLAHPDSGSIQVLGCSDLNKAPALREDIGVVFDECSFPEMLDAAQIGKVLGKIHPRWDKARYEQLLKRLELPWGKKIKDFSRGMKMKLAIAKILLEEGYIKKFDVIDDGNFKTIRIALKYGADKNEKIITGLKRISKPGLRVYAGKEELPKVLGGLGIAIISTNQGVITDKKARELQVGGEVLAFVW